MKGNWSSAEIAGTLGTAGALAAIWLAVALVSGCARPASSGWAQNSAVIAPSPPLPAEKRPSDEVAAMP